jgi:hypothetical protein
MKTPITKIRRIVAAIAIPALVITAATASAQTQQNNQLALQLGAIQLGYTTNATWYTNSQLLGNALIQGQKALLATTTNKYVAYVVDGTNAPATNQPVAQSGDFRSELYQATLNALNSPVLNTNKYTTTNAISVVTYNPKNGKLTTNKITSFGLNPVLTTPTAVLAIVNARVPNFDPGLISNAVASTMMTTSGTNTNGVLFPIWGPQPSAAKLKTATNAANVNSLNASTAATQLKNATAVASAAMTASLKAYVAGTKQWAGVPKTGPATNGVYLPNFSSKAQGPSTNQLATDIFGISSAAAAASANAINGLISSSTNQLYGQSFTNVMSMTKALAKVAVTFQNTSLTVVSGRPTTSIGALGAFSLGVVSQLAGNNNDNWIPSTQSTNSVLQGMLDGAVASVKAGGGSSTVLTQRVNAVVAGVAQGFLGTYLETAGYNNSFADVDNKTTVNTLSQTDLATSVQAALSLAKLTLPASTFNLASLQNLIDTAFDQTYKAFGYDPATGKYTPGTYAPNISSLTGAAGINNFNLVNGVGTPVTDTIGL